MASTEDAFAPPRDHSTPKHVPKKFGRESEEYQERKSLQTLQCSAFDDSSLTGVGWPHPNRGEKASDKTSKQFRPLPGPVKVYHDRSSPRKKAQETERRPTVEAQETQTDDGLLEQLIKDHLKREKAGDTSLHKEEEAYELMVKEPVPEAYWREIAEQRRLALNDTLEENKSLHKEMESLREENEKLSELASQAEYLSSLLQSVVSESDDDIAPEKDNGETKEIDNSNTTSDGQDNCEGTGGEIKGSGSEVERKKEDDGSVQQEPEHCRRSCEYKVHVSDIVQSNEKN